MRTRRPTDRPRARRVGPRGSTRTLAAALLCAACAVACGDSSVSSLRSTDDAGSADGTDAPGSNDAVDDARAADAAADGDPGGFDDGSPTAPLRATVTRVAPATLDARGGAVRVEGTGLDRIVGVALAGAPGVVDAQSSEALDATFGWLDPGRHDLVLRDADGAVGRVVDAVEVRPMRLRFVAASDGWVPAAGDARVVLAATTDDGVFVDAVRPDGVVRWRATGTGELIRVDGPPGTDEVPPDEEPPEEAPPDADPPEGDAPGEEPPGEELPGEESPEGAPPFDPVTALYDAGRVVACDAAGGPTAEWRDAAWRPLEVERTELRCVAMAASQGGGWAEVRQDGEATRFRQIQRDGAGVRVVHESTFPGAPVDVVGWDQPSGWIVATGEGVFRWDAAEGRGVRVDDSGARALAVVRSGPGEHDDLWVGRQAGPDVLLVGDGGGRFATAPMQALPISAASARSAHAADLNRDGFDELIVAPWTGALRVARSRGDGVFVDETPALEGDGDDALGVASVDLDGDGDVDLVTLHGGGRVRVWFSVP